ncbi:MAG: DUF11 domain-containing protein, partial [Phycisphaerae bacterium]|nr:DUF11 domain-containing protein [Phycisphaerae bacterium]
FQATVDVPGTVTQVVNIASAVSATHPVIQGGVTDCVTYTDLAVIKDVSDSTPMEVQVIDYSIIISNNGPITATGVEIGDVLPDEVQYNSHSNGNYVVEENTWYLGTLPVYGSTTLWINVTVREGTEGMTITNWAHLTYLNELDVVETNNHDDAVFEPWLTWAAISGLRAYLEDGNVVVEWETAGEIRTAGFDVYRLDSESGEWVLVNEEMVPGLLTAPQGGVYRVLDPGAKAGALRYKLVEHEFDGKQRTYGPYEVVVEKRSEVRSQRSVMQRSEISDLKSEISDLELDGYERAPHAPAEKSRTRRSAGALERKKAAAAKGWRANVAMISVREDGLYYIGWKDLAAQLGLDENKAKRLIRKRRILLKNMGRQVRYDPEPDGSGLYLFGEALDSIFTDDNVYLAGFGKAGTLGVVRGSSVVPVEGGVFWDWARAERDRWASTGLIGDPEQDFYMWEYVVAGNRTMSNRVFGVDVTGLADVPADARLSLHLQGAYGGPHHAVVLLNGTAIGQGAWSGLTAFDLELTFDQSLLTEGSNTVAVQGVKDPGVGASQFAVNSFEVGYARRCAPADDQLIVRADGQPVISVDGFSSPDIRVWNINEPSAPKVLKGVGIDAGVGGWRATFEAESPGDEFVVWCPAGRKAVAGMSGSTKTTVLTSRRNRADYVVITPRALRAGAEAWAAYRQGQGWRTMVVDLEEIYEVFGDGLKTPWAIRAFLDYAFTYWKTEPRYVLLVGKGTYDYKDAEGYGDNVLPAKLVSTSDGLFASDGWYADVVGNDAVPEMCVGRLPVLTEAELAALLAKVQAYEAAGGAWTRTAIFIADDPDGAGNFPLDSDNAAGLVPGDYVVRKYYLPNYVNEAAARAAIIGGINGGTMLVNYIGHGSYDNIGNGMLRNADVASLVNGAEDPVVLGFTCLMGRFELPGFDCLAENLLRSGTGGAAAVWSPTGLSVNSLARFMDQEVLKGTFEDGETLLGELVTRAHEAYADKYPQVFMLQIYNLLGDPASHVK